MVGLIIPCLFAVQLTILGGTRLVYAGGYSDPFAPYEAIMPGQPTRALESYRCQFERAYELETEATICRIYPDNSIFSQVSVLFHGDRIWQVVFKPEGLSFGYLVQRWGSPDDIAASNRHSINLIWDNSVYAVLSSIDTGKRVNYLLPVYDAIIVEDR
jgi:hypothetical protein